MDIPNTEREFLCFIATLQPVSCTDHLRGVYFLDENKVIKVGDWAYPGDYYTTGQNIREAATWDRLKDTEYGRHLAPVLAFDPEGKWLIMQRVITLSESEEVDREWCAFMRDAGVGDLGHRNVGRSPDDGRFVVLDYGLGRDDE